MSKVKRAHLDQKEVDWLVRKLSKRVDGEPLLKHKRLPSGSVTTMLKEYKKAFPKAKRQSVGLVSTINRIRSYARGAKTDISETLKKRVRTALSHLQDFGGTKTPKETSKIKGSKKKAKKGRVLTPAHKKAVVENLKKARAAKARKAKAPKKSPKAPRKAKMTPVEMLRSLNERVKTLEARVSDLEKNPGLKAVAEDLRSIRHAWKI